jgi:hypothetical protein
MNILRVGAILVLLGGICFGAGMLAVGFLDGLLKTASPDGIPPQDLFNTIAYLVSLVGLIPLSLFLMRNLDGPPSRVLLSLIALSAGSGLTFFSMFDEQNTMTRTIIRYSALGTGIIAQLVSGLYLIRKYILKK